MQESIFLEPRIQITGSFFPWSAACGLCLFFLLSFVPKSPSCFPCTEGIGGRCCSFSHILATPGQVIKPGCHYNWVAGKFVFHSHLHSQSPLDSCSSPGSVVWYHPLYTLSSLPVQSPAHQASGEMG